MLALLERGFPGSDGYHAAVYDRWRREWPAVLGDFEAFLAVEDEAGLLGFAGIQRHPIPYTQGAQRALVDHFMTGDRPLLATMEPMARALAGWAKGHGFARLTFNLEPQEQEAFVALSRAGGFSERVAMFCEVVPSEPESPAIRLMDGDERAIVVEMGTAIAEDLAGYPGALPAPDHAAMRELTARAYAEYGATREHRFFVAKGTSGLAGFLFAVREAPDVGLIYDLYVAPTYRRQGIARALYVSAACWLRSQGAYWLSLSVFATNPALQLYERWGFFAYFVAWELNL